MSHSFSELGGPKFTRPDTDQTSMLPMCVVDYRSFALFGNDGDSSANFVKN